MTLPRVVEYAVAVDWEDDDSFEESIDDISADVLASPGVSLDYGRDSGRALSPPMIGEATWVVNNDARQYSNDSTVSDRYQLVKPGRPTRIGAVHGEQRLYRSHTTYRAHVPYRGLGVWALHHGYLDTITQHPERPATTGLASLATTAALKRKVVTLGMYQTITTGTAIGHILDAADWPADKREIDTGDATLTYFWADEQTAWEALLTLVASEGAGATLWEDGDGILHFESRNFRQINARSITSQYTFYDNPGVADLWYTAIRYEPRWEDIATRITIPITQRETAGASSVVWELGTQLELNVVGDPVTIIARPTDPFVNAIPLDDGVDYTVTGGTATVVLDWTDGRTARIVATSTSGTAFVNDLQLRAFSVPKVGETVIEASHQTAVSRDKTLQLDVWPELDANQAQAIANAAFGRYGNPRPVIEIDVVNVTDTHMEAILGLRVSDRITIVNDHLGLDMDAWVERITHAVGPGNLHTLTLACEQVTPTPSGAVWNEGLWDSGLWAV